MRELEEAPYTVLAEHEGWEEREYPATTWVSTEGFDIFPHDGFTSQQVNYILKGPKHEIFEIEFFTQIRPVRTGDLGTGEKKLKFRKIEL